jgi:hypothetical protein
LLPILVFAGDPAEELSKSQIHKILLDNAESLIMFKDEKGGEYLTFPRGHRARNPNFVPDPKYPQDFREHVMLDKLVLYGKAGEFHQLRLESGSYYDNVVEHDFVRSSKKGSKQGRVVFNADTGRGQVKSDSGSVLLNLKKQQVSKNYLSNIKVNTVKKGQSIAHLYKDVNSPKNHYMMVHDLFTGQNRHFYGQLPNLRELKIDPNQAFPKSGPYPYTDLKSGCTFMIPGPFKRIKPHYKCEGSVQQYPLEEIDTSANPNKYAIQNGNEKIEFGTVSYINPLDSFSTAGAVSPISAQYSAESNQNQQSPASTRRVIKNYNQFRPVQGN